MRLCLHGGYTIIQLNTSGIALATGPTNVGGNDTLESVGNNVIFRMDPPGCAITFSPGTGLSTTTTSTTAGPTEVISSGVRNIVAVGLVCVVMALAM
jgi:hypothetical protein